MVLVDDEFPAYPMECQVCDTEVVMDVEGRRHVDVSTVEASREITVPESVTSVEVVEDTDTGTVETGGKAEGDGDEAK